VAVRWEKHGKRKKKKNEPLLPTSISYGSITQHWGIKESTGIGRTASELQPSAHGDCGEKNSKKRLNDQETTPFAFYRQSERRGVKEPEAL